MLEKLSKNDRFLFVSVILLLILFLLSFTKSCSSTDKRTAVKTALVNPKNKDSIYMLQLYDSENLINLSKINNLWLITEQNGKNAIPASSEKVENFITNLTNIRNLYELSDKINKNSSFGLTDSSAFHLRYYYQDAFHEITFGNQDFSLNFRYLMTDKNTKVYEIDDSLDAYLSTSVQVWSEPFLISQKALGKISKEDIQRAVFYTEGHKSDIKNISKLLELRHGGISNETPESSPDSTIKLELGNKNEINLEIYKTDNESEYLVKSTYKQNGNTSNPLVFHSKISLWTYNTIKESTL